MTLDAESPEILEFLKRWHEHGRAEFEANGYKNLHYDDYNPKTAKTRRKYVALDRGSSGHFLVERETGRVYTIKGYGVPNRLVGDVRELFKTTTA